MHSGNEFYVTYQFAADNEPEAEIKAKDIAIEQSAELPYETIPAELKSFVGRVSSIEQIGSNRWESSIRFKKELVAGDPLQFLNVIFGNVSIKPGIQITDLDRSYLSDLLPGPAIGIQGIREQLDAHARPLSCTALKPLGSSTENLAGLAEQFASGGIDIIKDDHGLANQPMAKFKSRVDECAQAIRKGVQLSGKKTLYFPNITGTPNQVMQRVQIAEQLGADGVLISPQLTGLNSLIDIARSQTGLPVMAHPAFSGPYTIHKTSGFKPGIFYGLLWRAFGADCIIYPNAGGRFSYTLEECLNINKECRSTDLNLRTALPVPAGGIDRNSLALWIEKYGENTLFLVGGSLYQHPEGLCGAAQEFQQKLTHHD